MKCYIECLYQADVSTIIQHLFHVSTTKYNGSMQWAHMGRCGYLCVHVCTCMCVHEGTCDVCVCVRVCVCGVCVRVYNVGTYRYMWVCGYMWYESKCGYMWVRAHTYCNIWGEVGVGGIKLEIAG